MKPSGLVSKEELSRISKGAEARVKAFGKKDSDKFAREAKSRVDAFAKRTGA